MSRSSAFAESGLPGVTVAVLALISTINALSTSAYLPALPSVGADLDASASTIQLTLTAYLVGVAIGQLTWGPVSDVVGRRLPMLIGLTCYVVASALCALAPGVGALLAFRALQGWSACAGTVLSRSVVADHAKGTRMAQLLTVLLLLGVLAPVLAPLIGSWLLLVGSWRSVFWFLAAMGVPMVVGAWLQVAESLPVKARRVWGWRELGRTVGGLLANRRFTGYAIAMASAFATMFVFMSAAPFLFQTRLGLSPQEYAWVNAGIAGCLGISMAIVNVHLGRQAKRGIANPARTARVGIVLLVVAAAAVLVVSLLDAPAPVWIAVLMAQVAALAPIAGSTMSLALGEASHAVGTGTALVGVLQAALGAVAAPLAGLGGAQATLPMALTMVLAACVSATAFGLASQASRESQSA
jgi:DHA1 family bicyclomycin/chloramphenicol resistance-like MFS transporter